VLLFGFCLLLLNILPRRLQISQHIEIPFLLFVEFQPLNPNLKETLTLSKTDDKPKRRGRPTRLEAKHKAHALRCRGNNYAVGAKSGRPKKWTRERINALIPDLEAWMKLPTSLYLKEFLCNFGILATEAEIFCARSKEFKTAWNLARQWQETKFVTQATHRKISENMSKFVLQNVHGWRNQPEQQDATGALYLMLERIANADKGLTIDVPPQIRDASEPEST